MCFCFCVVTVHTFDFDDRPTFVICAPALKLRLPRLLRAHRTAACVFFGVQVGLNSVDPWLERRTVSNS